MLTELRKMNKFTEILERITAEKHQLDNRIIDLYCLLSEDENRKGISSEQLQLLEKQFRYMCAYSDLLSERIKNIRDNIHINEFIENGDEKK